MAAPDYPVRDADGNIIIAAKPMSEYDIATIASQVATNLLTSEIPKPESKTPSPGTMPKAARPDHVHERLSSSTGPHALAANGEATVVFTKTFDVMPVPLFGYEEATDGKPVIIKVKSWTMTNGKYTGCVIKGYRLQTLPSSLIVLGALINFDVAAGSTLGVNAFMTAIQNSQ